VSGNVMSRGMIVPLCTPLIDRYAISEKLFDDDSLLGVNYEGTLIYSDEWGSGNDAYGLFFDRSNPSGAMMNELRTRGLSVVSAQARSYGCLWYTGVDNPLNEMTKQKFLERTGQLNA
jgi:hypothetical protein